MQNGGNAIWITGSLVVELHIFVHLRFIVISLKYFLVLAALEVWFPGGLEPLESLGINAEHVQVFFSDWYWTN